MRDRARVVIVGGGVGGTSVAYHLAQLGWTDVLLVERDQLTSGSTFHSAGLVGQLRGSVTLTSMMMYGTELYRRLHAETGHDPGWHEVGSLRLASTPERLEELRRQAGWAKTFGLPLELVSTVEAASLFQGWFDPAGVLGAVWLPTDGWLNPSDLTMALAAGARAAGVEIATGTRVTGIGVTTVSERSDRRRVTHVDVTTAAGPARIECEVVVNAGGMFAHEIGRLAGVDVPIVPMAHQYAITRPQVPVPPSLPTMRDPDRLVYFREEVGGMIMGGYERDPAPWCVSGEIPATFNNQLLAPDWDRFLPLTEAAQTLVPALADADVHQLVNGPEAFTPDGEFILGESDVAGFFVAAGFCAHGIAGAGGNGKVIAEWIVGGEPPGDLWRMDIRRFGPHYRSRSYCLARTHEVYSTYYDIAYPNHERAAGRPLRLPPAYARHERLGAVFGEKSGWERVNWYRSNEDPTHESLRPRGLGRRALVDGDRHRASGDPPHRRAVRRIVLRQVRGRRPRRARPARSPRGQRRRPRRRDDHVHPTAQLARRHRERPHHHPAGHRPLPRGHRHGVRRSGPGVDRHPRSGRRLGLDQRPHRRARMPRHLGAAGARHRGVGLGRRPDVPVHALPGDHRRRCPGDRQPSDLRRRARLGAVPVGRVHGAALGHAADGGAAPRPGARRIPGDRLTAPREGIPGLGQRHHERHRSPFQRARVRRAQRT